MIINFTALGYFYCPVCALVNNYLFIVHLSTVEVEVFHGMFSVNAIHI